jgi:hypothetical protein
MTPSSPARRIAATALIVAAALTLAASLVVGYASDALFDSEEFAERATAALDDEAVQTRVAELVTDDLVLAAEGDLIGARPVIESVTSGIVGGGAFRGLLRTAVRDVHRAAFEGDKNTLTLTLADIGAVVRGGLQALRPQLVDEIKARADVDLTDIEPPGWVADVAQVAEQVKHLAWILLAVALVLAGAGLGLAVDRRRAIVRFGVSVAIVGVAIAMTLGIARSLTLATIGESADRDAINAIWGVFVDDLRTALLLFAGCGVVLAAAASSLLRPVDLGAPLRRGWGAVATVPERPVLRFARAVALIAVGVVVIVRHEAVIELAVIAIGLYIAYAGVSEVMRMSFTGSEEQRATEVRQGRRSLIAAGVATAVIVVAGSVFVAGGGTEEEASALQTVGCNGSEALCQQPLDEVAVPTTHNAMSAATNPNWLFAQQEAGFPDQLHDGIRGLLIDAHYGQRTEEGSVATDLSDLSAGERATYVAEIGPAGLDAALRIRDRVVDSPPVGEREVFLCHRFCELGAIPIDDAFRQYRDFLAANPNEVLVVVIEDYVKPQDIEEAVDSSGLIDYVYDGPVDPMPTLQQMIDSGGRVLMMAENDAGGGAIPWYHEAYEALTQETPYTFKRPEALTDRARLDASCAANRGPDSAPFFLINHWVDTTPAPRPSNARQVNAHDALLARIRRCEKLRGLSANLIAVDFYREGDVFDVVRELNAERTE